MTAVTRAVAAEWWEAQGISGHTLEGAAEGQTKAALSFVSLCLGPGDGVG